MTTVAYMLATGLSLIVLTWCTMFIIASYTRAAVRGASERATRSAVVEYSLSRSVPAATQKCTDTFQEDLNAALPGTMQSNIETTCSVEAGRINVATKGDLTSLGPMFIGASLNETTSRPFEVLP